MAGKRKTGAPRGNLNRQTHGGEGAVKAIRHGRPFTGLAALAEAEVRAELDRDGRHGLVLRLAARLTAAADLYWNALSAAAEAGDLAQIDGYVGRFGWLGGAALRAWEQVKREGGDSDRARVVDAMAAIDEATTEAAEVQAAAHKAAAGDPMKRTPDLRTLAERWRRAGPVAWAEHRLGWVMEGGRPIVLAPWQKAVLGAWWANRDTTSTLTISAPKKVGKTLLNAVLLAWRWLALGGLHYANANDLDQSSGRQFKEVAAMCARHPLLADHVKAGRWRLEFLPTGAELEALAVDAAGSSGAAHWTSSHTECWGVIHEQSVRSYEELTGQPGSIGGVPSLRICDSYAGYEGESTVWHDLVDRGLAGERLRGDWPLFRAGGLLLFHMDGEAAQERCFRGSAAARRAYYLDQAAELRPGAFRRLHLNQRASAESAFIDPAQWDACLLDDYRIPGPNRDVQLYVGIDLGIKADYSAVVSTFKYGDQHWIGPHRIWKPSGHPPTVDLSSVEQYLMRLNEQYTVVRCAADPYQAASLIQQTERRGLTIHEHPQTVGNLTVMGNYLWDTIREGRLVVPSVGAEGLRAHVLAASAKETARGIRLIKGTGKIDAAIGLAISLVISGERKEYPPPGCASYISEGGKIGNWGDWNS